MESNFSFIERVLRIVTLADYTSELWWKVNNNNELEFYIKCSDVFCWGTADLEKITEDNIDLLEDSLNEHEIYGDVLFCARVRKKRPQGAFYRELKEENDNELIKKLNECGPEREINKSNPYNQDGKYIVK